MGACELGSFLQQMAVPRGMKRSSLTTLRDKLGLDPTVRPGGDLKGRLAMLKS